MEDAASNALIATHVEDVREVRFEAVVELELDGERIEVGDTDLLFDDVGDDALAGDLYASSAKLPAITRLQRGIREYLLHRVAELGCG